MLHLQLSNKASTTIPQLSSHILTMYHSHHHPSATTRSRPRMPTVLMSNWLHKISLQRRPTSEVAARRKIT